MSKNKNANAKVTAKFFPAVTVGVSESQCSEGGDVDEVAGPGGLN